MIPAFQKTAGGKDTSFQQSYGSSGEQARAVVSGLKADVVALSLEPDVTMLANKGIVARNWKNDKFANGEELWAQVTCEEAQRLELAEGA